jgi:aspartate 1-decarboxylase
MPEPVRDGKIDVPMFRKLLRAKLHQARVTFTDVNYHGSITIDTQLLAAAGLRPNEAVLIADCENGNRFETYIIPGEAGSGVIGINGAAARLTRVGNRVIIMAFEWVNESEIDTHHARVLILNQSNIITEQVDHPSRLPPG